MCALALTTVVFAGLAVSASSQVPCEVFRLENPIAPVDGTFGQAVALDGDRMLVGRPTHSSPSFGSAYCYELSAAGWSLAAEFASPEPEQSDYYGWAVALDGDIALVTKRRDGLLGSKGAVFVFQRQATGQWLSTQKITVDDHLEAWAFGWSMELEGTRAAIAAKGAGSVGPKGRVFIFELEDGVFIEKAKIQPSLDNLSDWFGASVALDGDRLAVGAPKGGSGRAYVFDRQPDGTWVEQALLSPPEVAWADECGYAVDVSGDRVVVTAPSHDLPWGNGGAVFVYELAPEGWVLADKVTSQAAGTFARFGWSVELTGDDLLVGAPTDNSAGLSAGCVKSFRRVDGDWVESPKLLGSDTVELGSFGWSMARDGDDLVVGAPASSTPGPARVHVFSFDGGAHLGGESASISVSSGGAQALQLGACPEHAGDFYFLLGTASGVTPPLPLGGALLPLVLDGYLAYTLAAPNSAMLQTTFGVLDPWGRGTATIALPPGAVTTGVGMMLNHAYVVLDATTLEVELASNATPLRLVP